MTAPKRYRQSMLTREKDFSTSTSGFIGTILSPTTSISPTTENHLNISNRQESFQLNQQIDFQKQTLHFEQKDEFHQKKSHLIQNHFEITSKPRTKNKQKIVSVTETIVDETQSNSEDDWVCPVAVALRRAGYNVPLRPSKSWLERDRKKQALLREQQTSSKEM